MAVARDRMRELFLTTKGFRNSPRISREELAATKTYDPVFGTTTSATHIATVEINPQTYQVRIDRYVVVLRLYDTPVGVATRTAKDAPMPSVTGGACA